MGRDEAESECGFERRSWHVSLVVIVDAAILGTIQEVICRQAADGVFSPTKQSSTHQDQKQVNATGRFQKEWKMIWCTCLIGLSYMFAVILTTYTVCLIQMFYSVLDFIFNKFNLSSWQIRNKFYKIISDKSHNPLLCHKSVYKETKGHKVQL